MMVSLIRIKKTVKNKLNLLKKAFALIMNSAYSISMPEGICWGGRKSITAFQRKRSPTPLFSSRCYPVKTASRLIVLIICVMLHSCYTH